VPAVRTQGLRSMNPLFTEPQFLIAMALVCAIVLLTRII
jgi:hypothetical protein